MTDPNNPYEPTDESGHNPGGPTQPIPPAPGYGYGSGYDGYGYGSPTTPPMYAAPMPHPEATKILVFGILGLACCQLFGPFAWIMGNRVMREIDAAPGAYTNRTEANIGRILGIIVTILMACLIVFYGGLLVLTLMNPALRNS